MRTEWIALLPGVLACWIGFGQSLQAAFLAVYLPVLLLIPDYFRLPIDGLPDPTFSQAAILPIGLAVCWKAFSKREWTFTSLDFCVLVYVAWQFISDFHNVGLADAQNLGFDTVTLALFPYICGKALIERYDLRAIFARRFVWLLFVVAIISVYEFRMGDSLFRPVFGRFFPGQDTTWFTQMRWGFGRIAGPYGHAILMGCILSIALLLCVWLSRSRQWETHFKVLGEVPFTKQQILAFGLVAGMVMTLSRGPWLGAVSGLILASVGFSVNTRKAFKRNAALLVLIAVLVYAGGKAYIANSPQPAETLSHGLIVPDATEVEQSTAYRAVLFDKYVEIVMQRPYWGWGRFNWPQVPGMSSIDNNYLFIALNTGLLGVAVFLTMLMVACWRLVRSGIATEPQDFTDRAFFFTMLGVIVSVTVSTASVFMGSQLYPLLFLFLGWADACTIGQSETAEASHAELDAATFDLVGVVA